jgi:hypothetical protein
MRVAVKKLEEAKRDAIAKKILKDNRGKIVLFSSFSET